MFDLGKAARNLATGGAQIVADIRQPFLDQGFEEEQRKERMRQQQRQELLNGYLATIGKQAQIQATAEQEKEARIPGQAREIAAIADSSSDKEARRSISINKAQTGNIQDLTKTVGQVQQDVDRVRSGLRVTEGREGTNDEIRKYTANTADDIRKLGARFQGLEGLIGKSSDGSFRSQASFFGGDPGNPTIDRALAAQDRERQEYVNLIKYGIESSKPRGIAKLANDLMPVARFGALIAGALS